MITMAVINDNALADKRRTSYAFERKARFYERRHNRQAQRLLVISPVIDAKARKVAEQLGIEIFSDSDEVETL